MSLRDSLSSYWEKFQGELFPFLEETVGFLTESHKALVTVVDMTRLEAFLPHWHGLPGRPLAERAALARAFVAKAVLNLPTTRTLIERVEADRRSGVFLVGHVRPRFPANRRSRAPSPNSPRANCPRGCTRP